MLRMYPHRKAKKMRLEKYRNAWFLLKLMESPEDGPITIQASADENVSAPHPPRIAVLLVFSISCRIECHRVLGQPNHHSRSKQDDKNYKRSTYPVWFPTLVLLSQLSYNLAVTI
jgi:hypothetical protein